MLHNKDLIYLTRDKYDLPKLPIFHGTTANLIIHTDHIHAMSEHFKKCKIFPLSEDKLGPSLSVMPSVHVL